MKSYLIPALALGLIVSSVPAQNKPDLTNPKQKASYAIGANFVTNLKRQEIELDAAALAAGVSDTLAGKPALSQDEVKAALMALQKDLMAKEQAKAEKYGDGAKNLKEGETFLAANKKKDGVKVKEVTVPKDGSKAELQYKVIKSGTGASPKKTDRVKVHYHGTLIDGTVFDSSVDRGEPITFPVGEVIPGWVEALQMMKVGDKWQLFIPSKLAYDERAASPLIGPNTTLIFEVELLGIEAPEATKSN